MEIGEGLSIKSQIDNKISQGQDVILFVRPGGYWNKSRQSTL